MMTQIINWDNVFAQSEKFQNNKPFPFGFIKEFINRNFYEKLYKTFPQIDDSWELFSDLSKHQYSKHWCTEKEDGVTYPGRDPAFSDTWNEFKEYCESDEFIQNMKKFSGAKITKLKKFMFTCYRRGGFQLAHIHNAGPSTLILMIYFSKNWKEGSPGGTFISTEENEDSIIFEPYDLDNSVALFLDGPKAAHGCRYISEDVTRQCLQIMLEGYSEETGWTASDDAEIKKERFKKAIDL